jgi:hypothetical protein
VNVSVAVKMQKSVRLQIKDFVILCPILWEMEAGDRVGTIFKIFSPQKLLSLLTQTKSFRGQ